MTTLTTAKDARRDALIERIGTFCDMLSSNPLDGEKGDVAYDFLRQAAAQISSDRLALASLTAPSPSGDVAGEAVETPEKAADNAATFCIEHLAKMLGDPDYVAADGSEEWEGDVAGTINNVLVAARVIDPWDWKVARHEKFHEEDALTTTTHTGEEAEGLKEAEYFIRKGAYYYRPNAQGYTSNKAEAGRYTLEEAISYSHPNGPDGPRDEISYELATKDALSTLQPSAGALLEALTKIKSYCEAGGRDTSFISETARTALGGGE